MFNTLKSWAKKFIETCRNRYDKGYQDGKRKAMLQFAYVEEILKGRPYDSYRVAMSDSEMIHMCDFIRAQFPNLLTPYHADRLEKLRMFAYAKKNRMI